MTSAGSTELTKEGFTIPMFGFEGGIHTFVSRKVSIDVGLGFDFYFPHGRLRASPEGTTTKARKVSHNFNLGIPVGVSLWM